MRGTARQFVERGAVKLLLTRMAYVDAIAV